MSCINIDPTHPTFLLKKNRIKSFESWPTSLKQTPEQLANAGFFYRGFVDRVTCFCCGGSLYGWSDEDDPMQEHERWYPNCEYIKQIKGEEYSSTNQAKESCENSSTNQTCKVCLVNNYNCLFLPCKHVVSCTSCSSLLSSCPYCRNPIETKLKIFLC